MHLLADNLTGRMGDSQWEPVGNTHLLADNLSGKMGDLLFAPPDYIPTAPVISGVSLFRLGSSITIDFEDPITGQVTVTAGGVPLTNIVQVSDMQVTADVAHGGYGEIDEQILLVCTDQIGASAPASVTILAPVGFISRKAAAAFRWAPGSGINDTCLWRSPVVYQGVPYNVDISSTGVIDFGPDAPLGISTDVRFLDHSANNLATALQSVTARTMQGPPTMPADANLTVAEGQTVLGALAPADSTDPPVYSIIAGLDSAFFTINPETGQVALAGPLDFDNPVGTGGNTYVFFRTASNSLGTAEVHQTVTVLVTNVIDEVTPDPILLPQVYGAPPGVLISGVAEITGPEAGAILEAVEFELSNDNKDTWSDSVTMVPGQTWVKATVTSNASPGGYAHQTGSVNGVDGIFTVRTAASGSVNNRRRMADGLTAPIVS